MRLDGNQVRIIALGCLPTMEGLRDVVPFALVEVEVDITLPSGDLQTRRIRISIRKDQATLKVEPYDPSALT